MPFLGTNYYFAGYTYKQEYLITMYKQRTVIINAAVVQTLHYPYCKY